MAGVLHASPVRGGAAADVHVDDGAAAHAHPYELDVPSIPSS